MGEKRQGADSSKIFLRPDVELPVALAALDHFGLCLDDPGVIDFSLQTKIGQIRAKLFLREYHYMEEAAAFILQRVFRNPLRETLFLFAPKQIDMQFVNKKNDISRDFVRVGNEAECHLHAEWVQDFHLRNILVGKLEEVGLEATFPMEVFCNIYTEEELDPATPKEGYSWVATEEIRDRDDEKPYEWSQLAVLRVNVPALKEGEMDYHYC